MDSRYYPNVEIDLPQLTTELRSIFDSEYEVQTFQVSTTSIVQARKSNTLRDLTGLSSALTIKVTPESGGTRVEIGMRSSIRDLSILHKHDAIGEAVSEFLIVRHHHDCQRIFLDHLTQ